MGIFVLLFLIGKLIAWQGTASIQSLSQTQNVQSVTFSSSGLYIYAAINNGIYIYTLPAYELQSFFGINKNITKILGHPSNQSILIIATYQGQMIRFNTQSGQKEAISYYPVTGGLINDIEWFDSVGSSLIVVGSSQPQILYGTSGYINGTSFIAYTHLAYILTDQLVFTKQIYLPINDTSITQISDVELNTNFFSFLIICNEIRVSSETLLSTTNQTDNFTNITAQSNLYLFDSFTGELLSQYAADNQNGEELFVSITPFQQLVSHNLKQSTEPAPKMFFSSHRNSDFVEIFHFDSGKIANIYLPNSAQTITFIQAKVPNSLFIATLNPITKIGSLLLYSISDSSFLDNVLFSNQILSIDVSFNRKLIATSQAKGGITCLYDTQDVIVVESLYIIIISILGGFILITVTVLAVVNNCSQNPDSMVHEQAQIQVSARNKQ